MTAPVVAKKTRREPLVQMTFVTVALFTAWHIFASFLWISPVTPGHFGFVTELCTRFGDIGTAARNRSRISWSIFILSFELHQLSRMMDQFSNRNFFLSTDMIDLSVCIRLLHCQHSSFYSIGNITERTRLIMPIHLERSFSIPETDGKMRDHMFETHSRTIYVVITNNGHFHIQHSSIIQET